jgi:hypothetical protein
MIDLEALRASVSEMGDAPFPLLSRRGAGRVVAVDDGGLDLLVGGLRARVTWDRFAAALHRLSANHTVSVDEMGGGHDAAAIVSLLAHALANDVSVIAPEGLLVVRDASGTPIHQYADMGGLVQRWPRHRRAAAG